MRLRKIDPGAPGYDVVDYDVVNGQYGRMRAVVNAKCDVLTEMATRPPSEFPLDANNADGRATPLRCRRQVKQVTQEIASAYISIALICHRIGCAFLQYPYFATQRMRSGVCAISSISQPPRVGVAQQWELCALKESWRGARDNIWATL